MATLLMFSGGIDSTAALVKLLQESSDPLIVHHIYKYDAESQYHAEVEAIAVNNVLEYCKKNYREFTFTSSKWEFGLPYFGWNLTLCAFVGAQVIRSFGDTITRYVVGTHQDDVFMQQGIDERGFGDGSRRLQEALGVFYASFGTSNRETLPSIYWPLKDMTRQQVVDSLPKDLLALTWTCRQPIKLANGEFDICGQCISCKTLHGISGLHRSFTKTT